VTHPIKSTLSRLWWSLRHRVWHLPLWQSAYLAYLRRHAPALFARTVRPDTDIVIEAFPRSANTFLVHALEIIAEGRLNIAHHLHDPVQITRGVAAGIPVIVIIRTPEDAVSSWMLKSPWMDPALALRIYNAFYKCALAHGDAVTLIPYDQLIAAPQEVLATIYERLGRTPPALLETLDQEAVFASIEARKRQREGSPATATDFALSVARPTADKDARKAALHAQIAARAPALLENAQGIFHQALASVKN
jgi:hypothetical protein